MAFINSSFLEENSELKSLYDVSLNIQRMLDKLKQELETNLTLDTLSKTIKANRNLIEVQLLLQVKTKRILQTYKEDLNNLLHRISTRKAPKKVRKTRVSLFENEASIKSNGKLSYYFHIDGIRCEKVNSELQTMSKFGHKFLSCIYKPKNWRFSDAKRLTKGVLQTLKLEKLDELLLTLRNSNEMSDEKLLSLERNLNSLTNLSLQSKGVSPTDHFCNQAVDRDYNWDYISKKLLKNRFTAEECRIVWNLVAKPSICKDPWTPEEDLLLRRVVIDNDHQNWDYVNDQLPNPRSPFLCFVRYQTKFKVKKRSDKKVWREEDNLKLDEALDEKTFSFSEFVSKFFIQSQNVSKKQVISHFRYRMLMRKKTVGRFSKREQFLINSFAARGYSYCAIAQILGTRTSKQIKDYLVAQTDKYVHGKWNKNEIHNLLKSVKFLGDNNWAFICKFVKGRSSVQCHQKFMMLKIKRPDLIEKYLKKSTSSSHLQFKKINYFLKNEENKKKNILPLRKKSLDMKIESYFLKTIQGNSNRVRTVDETLFIDSVFSLLHYLNCFQVPNCNEFNKEVYEWLIQNPISYNIPLPFEQIFSKYFLSVRSSEFKYCGRHSFFSHILSRSTNLFPPSRCTIHGFNNFIKNCESYAKLNDNIDFREMWKKINSKIGKNKEFLEAKIFWYRILKSMFYWPIKLKSISIENLLST